MSLLKLSTEIDEEFAYEALERIDFVGKALDEELGLVRYDGFLMKEMCAIYLHEKIED